MLRRTPKKTSRSRHISSRSGKRPPRVGAAFFVWALIAEQLDAPRRECIRRRLPFGSCVNVVDFVPENFLI
jgi:hypothetical protein